MNKLLIKMEIR